MWRIRSIFKSDINLGSFERQEIVLDIVSPLLPKNQTTNVNHHSEDFNLQTEKCTFLIIIY